MKQSIFTLNSPVQFKLGFICLQFADPVWCGAHDGGGGSVPLPGHAHQQAVCSSFGGARYLRS